MLGVQNCPPPSQRIWHHRGSVFPPSHDVYSFTPRYLSSRTPQGARSRHYYTLSQRGGYSMGTGPKVRASLSISICLFLSSSITHDPVVFLLDCLPCVCSYFTTLNPTRVNQHYKNTIFVICNLKRIIKSLLFFYIMK